MKLEKEEQLRDKVLLLSHRYPKRVRLLYKTFLRMICETKNDK